MDFLVGDTVGRVVFLFCFLFFRFSFFSFSFDEGIGIEVGEWMLLLLLASLLFHIFNLSLSLLLRCTQLRVCFVKVYR